MASVKVAVRVRPFNERELEMDSKLVIEMEGKKTRIANIKLNHLGKEEAGREKYKDFTFDHSYWSTVENDPRCASQEQVFNDLGTDVVKSAFDGYNACVFAYGQTGSGKTYTMMGSSESLGLIPRICKALFARMKSGNNEKTTYRTEVSYLEIYNEKVRDLLKGNHTHSLRVREHMTQGPYVENLSKHLVMDYADIEELMTRGNNLRTTASTRMNNVSSRSHAIFTVVFVQATFAGNMPRETVSKVHLVDLAGSERAESSLATGQRLKEGSHINRSLVTLGSVISALAELSSSKIKKQVFIPYRDSVLTWLLKDSLGGNSKTIMIAAISPADCSYGETMSTLRYANRAKNIINKPTVNEDANVKLIRELRAEINKLKSMLGTGGGDNCQIEPQMLEQLQRKEAQEKVLTEEWTERWRETQKILFEQRTLALRKAGQGVVLDSDRPHLLAIDDDPLSTGITLYHLREGETTIGSEDIEPKKDIVLVGPNVEANHCTIHFESGVATLVPHEKASCWVNGVPVDKPTRLSQGCNILLGRTNMFRYNDPAEVAQLRKVGSRSQMNLSRLSLLSMSATDLAWSCENIHVTSKVEEQLEAEKAALQKEREAQKKEREAQKKEQEQCALERKALQEAMRNLQEERKQMQGVFAAQRKKLAEELQNVGSKEKETMARFQLKEQELAKRKEELVQELEQEKALVDRERAIIEQLRGNLRVLVNNSSTESQYLRQELLNAIQDKESREMQEMVERDAFEEVYKQNIAELEEKRQAVLETKELAMKQNEAIQHLESEIQSKLKALSERQSKIGQLELELATLEGSSRAALQQDKTEGFAAAKNRDSGTFSNHSSDESTPSTEAYESATSVSDGWKLGFGNQVPDAATEEMVETTEKPDEQPFIPSRDLNAEEKEEIQTHIGVQDNNIERHCINREALSKTEAKECESDCRSSTECEEKNSRDTDVMKSSLEFHHCDCHARRKHKSRTIMSATSMPGLNTCASSSESQEEESSSLSPCSVNLPLSHSMASYLNSLHSGSIAVGDEGLSVKVPSFVFRGSGSNSHFEYEVHVVVQGEKWTILRRYRRFRELHQYMKYLYGQKVARLNFPPRRLFGKKSETLARERRELLEAYLSQLLEVCCQIKGCPLYDCAERPTKQALYALSPFFQKGMFDSTKYGTS